MLTGRRAQFTSFCVEAGTVATRILAPPMLFQFVQDRKFVDRTTAGTAVERLVYIPEIERLVACESGTTKLSLYDASLNLVNRIDVVGAVNTVSGGSMADPTLEGVMRGASPAFKKFVELSADAIKTAMAGKPKETIEEDAESRSTASNRNGPLVDESHRKPLATNAS